MSKRVLVSAEMTLCAFRVWGEFASVGEAGFWRVSVTEIGKYLGINRYRATQVRDLCVELGLMFKAPNGFYYTQAYPDVVHDIVATQKTIDQKYKGANTNE